MSTNDESYTIVPFPKLRRLMVDGGQLGRRKHTVHGLVEMDVTRARQLISDHKARTGEALSFTAFIIACLGRAVEMNKYLHAYRNWRGQLVIYDEVDVNTMFEVEVDGRKIVRPHIIRRANKKTFRELHAEMRAFQAENESSQEASFIRWFVLLPGPVRRFFYGLLFKNPHMLKDYFGTVVVTSVGMFGSGAGWGIPVPNHTLQITLGGIAERPGVIAGRIEMREYLCVTISFDHDIVDGAPAARFTQRLKELIEAGYGLCDEESSTHVAAQAQPVT
jgi:pyruvate/2-oxoglutarate dehydrogenase complex dihydrolipoamide acyltransferase (E2) component